MTSETPNSSDCFPAGKKTMAPVWCGRYSSRAGRLRRHRERASQNVAMRPDHVRGSVQLVRKGDAIPFDVAGTMIQTETEPKPRAKRLAASKVTASP